ncbi:MAG: hypothetical protein ACP6IT_05265 [Candidatus Thorarchaeota archaeon]
MSLGFILLLLGLILTVLAIYMEAASRSCGRMPASHLARMVVGSQFSNFAFYLVAAESLMMGVGVWFYEATLYEGLIGILLVGGVAMFVTVAAANHIRFAGSEPNAQLIAQGYLEAIRDRDPREGIDYIVQYIQDPRWGVPPSHLKVILTQMASRSDGFGDAAREKLVELGLLDTGDVNHSRQNDLP